MKMKLLPRPVPIRERMPLGGYTSCLPPLPTVRVVKPVVKKGPLEGLTDEEMLAIGDISYDMKYHDWTYEFSDDGTVWRRGHEQRRIIEASLATLPFEQAAALWEMYAPVSFGGYKRP